MFVFIDSSWPFGCAALICLIVQKLSLITTSLWVGSCWCLFLVFECGCSPLGYRFARWQWQLETILSPVVVGRVAQEQIIFILPLCPIVPFGLVWYSRVVLFFKAEKVVMTAGDLSTRLLNWISMQNFEKTGHVFLKCWLKVSFVLVRVGLSLCSAFLHVDRCGVLASHGNHVPLQVLICCFVCSHSPLHMCVGLSLDGAFLHAARRGLLASRENHVSLK